MVFCPNVRCFVCGKQKQKRVVWCCVVKFAVAYYAYLTLLMLFYDRSYAPLFLLTVVLLSGYPVDGVKHAVKLYQCFVLRPETVQLRKSAVEQFPVFVLVLHDKDGRLIAAVRVRLEKHAHLRSWCIALLLDNQVTNNVPRLLQTPLLGGFCIVPIKALMQLRLLVPRLVEDLGGRCGVSDCQDFVSDLLRIGGNAAAAFPCCENHF
uniref:Uncharacterized protein n=1 Tax=Siphoviridae sp. ctRPk8 TaxID=2827870 RepID=A0A8S5SJS8_9CAUD|nr:MAG TPA: hypothetical protein [Siphoviridae sp. ctRPk8]